MWKIEKSLFFCSICMNNVVHNKIEIEEERNFAYNIEENTIKDKSVLSDCLTIPDLFYLRRALMVICWER